MGGASILSVGGLGWCFAVVADGVWVAVVAAAVVDVEVGAVCCGRCYLLPAVVVVVVQIVLIFVFFCFVLGVANSGHYFLSR